MTSAADVISVPGVRPVTQITHLKKSSKGVINDESLHRRSASTWGGVTKPISSIPLFFKIFSIVKTHVSYWISRLYLTGVPVAQLRWHMSNINVIQIILEVILTDRKFC